MDKPTNQQSLPCSAPLGFIKVHRSLRESWVAQDPHHLALWTWLMMLAAFKPHSVILNGIPIDELASSLSHPERFLGIHFFNPVRKMPLVEIIRGTKTSAEAVATAFDYAKKIKKSPILVRSGPGFLVNRLLLPYMSEAVELLLEGVEPRTVDRVATRFGMPMGPIQLYDVVGLDVAAYAGKTMVAAFPETRVEITPCGRARRSRAFGPENGPGILSLSEQKTTG